MLDLRSATCCHFLPLRWSGDLLLVQDIRTLGFQPCVGMHEQSSASSTRAEDIDVNRLSEDSSETIGLGAWQAVRIRGVHSGQAMLLKGHAAPCVITRAPMPTLLGLIAYGLILSQEYTVCYLDQSMGCPSSTTTLPHC